MSTAARRRLYSRVRVFLERGCAGDNREDVRIRLLQMPAVVEPFDRQISANSAHVVEDVVQVGLRQAFKRTPRDEFLQEVKDRPEEVCEAIVFKQVGIPQEEEYERSHFSVSRRCSTIFSDNIQYIMV